MRFELKIALRYIFSKRSYNFITVITFISIIGISAGTAALIIVMAVFNGFQDITIKQIVGFDPHIRITAATGNKFEYNEEYVENLKKIKGISSITPLVVSRAVAVNGSTIQVLTAFGVSPDNTEYLSSIIQNTASGKFDLNYGSTGRGMFAGIALADRLGLMSGQSVKLYSPAMIENALRTYSNTGGEDVYPSALFQSNIKDYDLSMAFIHIDLARKLNNLNNNEITSYDVRLVKFEATDKVVNEIKNISGQELKIESWKDLNRDLYQVMQFERMASASIIAIIILIAIFNVLSSLAMTVTEKKQDIGLLKAIGARSESIRKTFLLEGGLIGAIGTFSGTTLGLLFVYGQINFKWFRIDTNKYIIDAIPMKLIWEDVAIVVIFAFLLSLVATLYPAYKAGKTITIDAIRGE